MTEIVVFDALCGSGKTTKVREYMLSKPNEKYIYISPFLKESYNTVGIITDIDGDEVEPKISSLTGLIE